MSEPAAGRCERRRFRQALAAGIWLLLLPGVTLAQPNADVRAEVSRQLTTLLGKLPDRTQVGLAVADVADGQRWFARQPHTPLKPASVMKLFVTAAALQRWGPDFEYRTRVFVHDGELWIVGVGDPGLGDERLAGRHGRPLSFPFDQWIAALKTRGIATLDRIVLDDSVFDRQWRHPDWPENQAQSWYQAPVGGLNFNDNCLDARVAPRDGIVRLILRPDLPSSFYTSSLRLGKRHKPVVRRALDTDVFEFRGSVSKDARLGPVSVRRPTVFFGHALKHALAAEGIDVRGNVVRRTITPEARAAAVLVAEHITPLEDLLWRCNTFSQNLFAECLLKSLPAYAPDGSRTGRTGGWQAGTQLLRTTLADMDVDLSTAVLRDGSGLSHANRLTAEQATSLLVRMHHHRHAAAFIESLAVPGRPGTLRRRYADPALSRRLRGKTGTLSGVRSLAGYIARPDGTTLAFALLCNGQCDPELPGRIAGALVLVAQP